MADWLDDDTDEYPTASTRGVTDEPERPEGLALVPEDLPEADDDFGLAANPAPASTSEGLVSPGFDENWTPDQGFGDPTDAVRIWADEDGNLARVRLAIGWRTRLGEADLGEVLTDCFEQLNFYFHPDAELPVPDDPEPDPRFTHMSWELLGEIRAQQLELMEKFSALGDDEPPSHWDGTEAVGDDWDDSVAVRLNVLGHPVAAAFVADWLAGASNHDITVGIMGAYRKARSRHIPPTAVWSEHAKLGFLARQLSVNVEQSMRGGVKLASEQPDA